MWEEVYSKLKSEFRSVFSDPTSEKKQDPTFPVATSTLDSFDFTIDDIKSAIDDTRLNLIIYFYR